MARYYQRPENALKRANEFIEVGKPTRALETLYEVIKSKRRINYSEKVLEPIMFKYLELCVELKKSHVAKEGLFQYRNMCQTVNVASLENVVRGYLKMAEDRTKSVQEQARQTIVDVDDLDNIVTPESILMNAVSGDAQERSDRALLTPWIKFLWESYCQCLELLRINSRVEKLYHDIAHESFKFCLKYNRKTEFRKLCEKLRKHLDDIMKLPSQPMNISLNNPETQLLNMETRLFQLDTAIQMELWQEAYRAIDDIRSLMMMSKKMSQPKMMANYYQKLALVFWKAGNSLFHAASLFKLFQLFKDMKKNVVQEELQKMASRVLLATLSINLPSSHPEFDRFIEIDRSPMDKAQRLAILLGLSQPPTRAGLVKDLLKNNVVSSSLPKLQKLYRWLEVDFHPLEVCKHVELVTTAINENDDLDYLKQYVVPLQDFTVIRLIKQISQVYQTIQFERVLELARFSDPFRLERILVDAVRHNDLQIRIDHRNGCLHFGMDLSESQRQDHMEGPYLQSLPSEQVRLQLVNMRSALQKAINIISPQKKKIDDLKAKVVHTYHETKDDDHERILSRHRIIETRKEYLEKLNTEREVNEQRRADEALRQQMMAEQKRLDDERNERERKRKEIEFHEVQQKHLKEKMAAFQQTAIGQKVMKKTKLDEENMNAEEFAQKQEEELERERKETQQRLKALEKKVDYLERAKRIEEIPLLETSIEERQAQDREFWEQQENERISLLQEERKLATQHRERLTRMKKDKEKFIEMVKESRRTVFEAKRAEFDVELEAERLERLQKRKEQRKEERREKWIKDKEEKERKKREAAQRKKEEEEEKIKKAKELEDKLIYEEKKKKLEEIEEKKRKREQEIEEKQKREEERSRELAGRDRNEGPRRAGGGGGGGRGEMDGERERPPLNLKPSDGSWRSNADRGEDDLVRRRNEENLRNQKSDDTKRNEQDKELIVPADDPKKDSAEKPVKKYLPPSLRRAEKGGAENEPERDRDSRDFRGRDNRDIGDNRDSRDNRDFRDNQDIRDRDNRERDSKLSWGSGGGARDREDKDKRYSAMRQSQGLAQRSDDRAEGRGLNRGRGGGFDSDDRPQSKSDQSNWRKDKPKADSDGWSTAGPKR